MKYYELDKEEEQILKDFESGHFTPVPNEKKEIARLAAIAKHSLSKTKTVNIRMSEKDLFKLKEKAVREGLPYQTLISSVLHKSVA